MDVKQAVRTAAGYVASLEGITSGEQNTDSEKQVLSDIRFAVEGTRYDEDAGRWYIEVGFARKWDQVDASPLAGLSSGVLKDNRTFKTVAIDDATGKVLAYGSN